MTRINKASGAVLAAAIMASTAAWVLSAGAPEAHGKEIHVYMSPWCGCCGEWVEHVKRAGIPVRVTETEEMESVKERLGVPDSMQSCHTAEAGGYVIEGHVPVSAIRKLLDERPGITGIALPGMPAGSPGMGGVAQATYQVEAFSGGRSAGRYMDAPAR